MTKPINYKSGREEKATNHFTLLDPLTALVADQERRARTSRVSTTPSTNVDTAKRLSELIEQLEEVDSRQMSQPGGVTMQFDPIVTALIREGDAAVEPLLNCLEQDQRLTRSVSFHRDFFSYRKVHGVSMAAYAALRGILAESFQPTISPFADSPDLEMRFRRAAATEIREHRRKFSGIPVVEQWYRILSDDSASGEAWLQAAQRITTLKKQGERPSAAITTISPSAPMPGEALRAKASPSVTEAMSKRVAALASQYDQHRDTFALHHAHKMAMHLAKWDARGAVPALRELMVRCKAGFNVPDGNRGWQVEYLGACIGKLTITRARGGDTDAFADYAQWLRTRKPAEVAGYLKETLRPLWTEPANPVLADVAANLFVADGSAWEELVRTNAATGSHQFFRMLETPLILISSFQKHVLDSLTNRTVIGSAYSPSPGQMSLELDFGSRTQIGNLPENDSAPGGGQKVDVRTCDYTAWLLQRIEGAQRYMPYWPEAQRDATIASLQQFLRGNSLRLKLKPNLREPDDE